MKFHPQYLALAWVVACGDLAVPSAARGGEARVVDAAVLKVPDAQVEDEAELTDGARPEEMLLGDAAMEPPALASWSFCERLRAEAGLTEPSEVQVAWSTLICETVDLDRFVRPPEVPYRALLATSYDRASKQEGDSDDWFANNDAGNYVRIDGDERVMMEAQGPGVITRIWSANPSGRLRIYLDDAERPAIDVEMEAFFAGSLDDASSGLLVFEAGLGQNAYLPLPYARYARVTTTSSKGLFYQVDHRAYADGTSVEPFSLDGLRSLSPLLDALRAYLVDPSAWPALGTLPVQTVELGPNAPEQTVELGPAVIRELVVSKFDAGDDRLRSTRLILSVDGERTVDAPLGDLFGAGPGLQSFASLAAEMRADALVLRWPMPVRAALKVTLQSTQAVPETTLQLRYEPGLPEQARRFHARWTGTQTFSTRDVVDWTLLHVNGAGWYVGTLLNANNSTAVWWGEGDEKIFIDGEAFPSHFGTGTEDYFGQAWCSTQLPATPWVGQTRADGPINTGRSSNYRWHVPDAIPFSSELRFKLEVQHWFQGVLSFPLTEDAVAYWYAEEGATLDGVELETSEFRAPEFQDVEEPAVMPRRTACKL